MQRTAADGDERAARRAESEQRACAEPPRGAAARAEARDASELRAFDGEEWLGEEEEEGGADGETPER
eukprot:997721-Prymnesium_polylepis.1